MTLRKLWEILTTPPEAGAVSACSYGVPLTQTQKEQAFVDSYMNEYEKAWNEYLLLGAGVVKVEHIRLGADNPDMIRETKIISNETDVNPLSGIPYSDAARKRMQLDTFLFEYFPDAFLAVANVAIVGNEQHNPGQPLHWAREKSKDQFNTAFRHYWERRRGVFKDTDGQYHLAKAIWRLSAQLQLDIEEDRKR